MKNKPAIVTVLSALSASVATAHETVYPHSHAAGQTGLEINLLLAFAAAGLVVFGSIVAYRARKGRKTASIEA